MRLHPDVAVREEPFGALAYHYGNRKLVFLKHHGLVEVVNALDAGSSLDSLLDTLPQGDRAAYQQAITQLLQSEMLIDD